MGLVVLLSLIALAGFAVAGYELVTRRDMELRGVLTSRLTEADLPVSQWYGVNASLEQYSSDDELRRVLELVREGGFHWVRQVFPWADIEPQQGEFHWESWDRLVTAVAEQGLELVAVLETAPAWAQSPADRQNRLAPPQYPTTLGLFARQMATRYSGRIHWYQVWDQPNIAPHWGSGPVDARGYVRLLRTAATEIRSADPSARILCAALAPNTEAGGRNESDVLFLRGIYQSGGQGWFDALAAKPYGFWSGPEDRRVSPDVLNFSRLILLREEMVRFGDGQVPIWAAEFGWNALPADWKGETSPWGTDSIDRQAERSVVAVKRARSEWGWLGPMIWAELQPTASPDDARWGFALLGQDLLPTQFYSSLRQVTMAAIESEPVDQGPFRTRLGLVSLLALLSLAAGAYTWPRSPWVGVLQKPAAAFCCASETLQVTLLGATLLLFWLAPWSAVSLVALALGAAIVWLRPDLGLAYVVVFIPFYANSGTLLGRPIPLLEVLLWICFVCGTARLLKGRLTSREHAWPGPAVLLGSMTSLDWACLSLVLVSALSLGVSENRSVSVREFRVVILEPAMLYVMLRTWRWERRALRRLAWCLVIAGVSVSLVGLCQYVTGVDVIVAEGVRRVRAVYGSPNNLSLFLGRVIPLALAAAAAGVTRRLRKANVAALLVLLACLLLTFSRAGWLLSLPAAFLTVGLFRRRRTLWVMVAALLVCFVVLLPLAGTQRLASLLNLEEGTTFRRLELWKAAWEMIQDHPLTGVGLDNFLYRYPDYMRPEAWQEPNLSHPHNIVLDFWTRLGVGGLAVLVWLLASFYRSAVRLYRRLPDSDDRAIILGWIASMAAMLAHGLVDHSFFLVDLALVFFLTLGWVSALTALLPDGQEGTVGR
jgi:O-antigen ligase